jgi:hypothetical protein
VPRKAAARRRLEIKFNYETVASRRGGIKKKRTRERIRKNSITDMEIKNGYVCVLLEINPAEN